MASSYTAAFHQEFFQMAFLSLFLCSMDSFGVEQFCNRCTRVLTESGEDGFICPDCREACPVLVLRKKTESVGTGEEQGVLVCRPKVRKDDPGGEKADLSRDSDFVDFMDHLSLDSDFVNQERGAVGGDPDIYIDLSTMSEEEQIRYAKRISLGENPEVPVKNTSFVQNEGLVRCRHDSCAAVDHSIVNKYHILREWVIRSGGEYIGGWPSSIADFFATVGDVLRLLEYQSCSNKNYFFEHSFPDGMNGCSLKFKNYQYFKALCENSGQVLVEQIFNAIRKGRRVLFFLVEVSGNAISGIFSPVFGIINDMNHYAAIVAIFGDLYQISVEGISIMIQKLKTKLNSSELQLFCVCFEDRELSLL